MTFTLPCNTTKRIGTTLLMLLLSISSFLSYGQDFSHIKTQKPINVSGSLEGRGTFYNASGIGDRRLPFSYLFNGNANVSIYGLSIPFSVAYSESDRSYSQPFNQFGMSPTYKWVTLHVGYRNIEYSPYTLGGHTMLGAGIELHPGKLRVGFMHGLLNRATTVDSATQAFVPYSFSRTGTAAKIGYGTDNNFFELSYLQARDDSSSVKRSTIKPADYVAPAANNVLGYSYKFSFLKHFTLESRGAVSVYTRDINSNITFDRITNKMLQKLQSFTGFNGTSEIYTAIDASLTYRSKYFGLKTDYKRIEPDYRTLGAYYFSSDLESWTFGPNFTLFNGKVRLTGSIGTQHDNLLNQKRSTNKRFISSGNASVDLSKALAMDVNYSNFSNDQRPNIINYPDSLRVVQTTSNLTITPRYTIISTALVQVFSISVSLNQLNDLNQVITSRQEVNRTIDTKQYFFNYIASLPKQGASLFFNLNRTELKSEIVNNVYQGFTIGGNTSLLKRKLQAGVNSSFIQSKGQQGESLIINGAANLAYRLGKKQTLKTALFFTSNQPPGGTTQKAYSELRSELSYIVNF